MRSIYDLNDDEKVGLTEQQMEDIIRWHCAEEGVKFSKKPDSQVYEKIEVPKNDKAFKIKPFQVYIRSKDTALKLISLLSEFSHEFLKEKTDWSIGYDYKMLEQEETALELSEERFYDVDDLMNKAATLRNRKSEKERYDSEKSAWDKFHDKFKKIADNVYDEVAAARSRIRSKQRLSEEAQEFLRLASGDLVVALKFFIKANPDFAVEEIKTAFGSKADEAVEIFEQQKRVVEGAA